MSTFSAANALAGSASSTRRVVASLRAKGVSRLESRLFGDAALAADCGHRASGLPEALFSNLVLQLLAPHRVADQRLDFLIRGSRAHRLAQVGLVQREEAGAQLALGGQAHAVAV